MTPGALRAKRNRALYPPNWREISEEVRRRAGYCCQHCGARHRWFHPITGSVVFLQAAHMDHNPPNCDWSNLKALCQRCHLIYDARIHAIRAYMTRRKGRALELFEDLAA